MLIIREYVVIVGTTVKFNYITYNIQNTQTENNNKNNMEGDSYDGPTGTVQVSYSTRDQTVLQYAFLPLMLTS